ncbi:MAG TPA: hypothetical protein VMX97_01640, partial [Hyphomicrobiaceae bacterium]|nr:hypothetical protein [Hyphomicrobiaceae bacterium]
MAQPVTQPVPLAMAPVAELHCSVVHPNQLALTNFRRCHFAALPAHPALKVRQLLGEAVIEVVPAAVWVASGTDPVPRFRMRHSAAGPHAQVPQGRLEAHPARL